MEDRNRTDGARRTGHATDASHGGPAADRAHVRPGMKVTHVTDPSPGKPKPRDRPTGIVSEDWETGAVDPLNER